MAEDIVAELRLELSAFRKDLKEAIGEAKKGGEDSGESFGDGLLGGLTGVKGKLLGLAAAFAGAFTFKEAIAAAAHQEQAIQNLNVSLAQAGNYSAQYSKDLQELAGELQRTTAYSDDTVESAAALIETIGKLGKTELKRATVAATDLAAALNIDLDSAARLVGKAAEGNVSAFQRYGIEIRKGKTDTETFANALTVLEAKFGGVAKAQATTFAGATAKAKNAFEEILESIGNFIVKSPTVILLINKLANGFNYIAEVIGDFSKQDYFKGFALGAIEFGIILTKAVIGPLEALYNVGKFVFEAFGKGIAGVAAALVSVAKGDFSGAKEALGSTALSIGESFGDQFNLSVTTGVTASLQGLSQEIENNLPPIEEKFKNSTENIKGFYLDTFGLISAGADESFSRIATVGEEGAKRQVEAIKKIQSAFDGFKRGFAQSFSAIGQALVQGTNLFQAFGKAILGVFGDLAIQLGTEIFLLGLGTFNPAQAGIGLALITLGGALKALSGGAGGLNGGSEPVTTSGGGVAGGLGGSSEATSTEKRVDSTSVVVNVQGNILDRKESGLELAAIIRDNFSQNGLVVGTA